jgi:thioesterase domain-containing protein/acyl carrier protein
VLREDGVLEFRGRKDATVKIRGYLVEPAEVEAALHADPAIDEAAVAGVPRDEQRPEAGARLVAWVRPADPTTFSSAQVRRRLRERLPVHMVPGVVVPLAALPRTERGKIDRAALPPVPPPRTAMASAPLRGYDAIVAGLWQEVLGVDDIGADDDFFDLGGDSLTAEEMLARAGEQLGTALPSSALLSCPTLREFAQLVADGAPRQGDLLALASGPGHPVHLIAGAGGLALGLLPLARRLSEAHPVYGIQAHALERRGVPDWTVGQAAARAVRDIRRVQATGPYVLGGHSAGGTIALEVARRLTGEGEQVALVALLDSPPPGTVPPADTRTASAAGADLARAFAQGTPPARRDNRLLRAVRLALTGVVPQPKGAQFQQFHRQGRWMLRLHRPKPWAGRTVVYRAEAGGGWGARDWAPLLVGDWAIRTTPGRHLTMIREPHAAHLATVLRADISGALQGIAAHGQ